MDAELPSISKSGKVLGLGLPFLLPNSKFHPLLNPNFLNLQFTNCPIFNGPKLHSQDYLQQILLLHPLSSLVFNQSSPVKCPHATIPPSGFLLFPCFCFDFHASFFCSDFWSVWCKDNWVLLILLLNTCIIDSVYFSVSSIDFILFCFYFRFVADWMSILNVEL